MDKQINDTLRKLVAIDKLAPSSGSLLDYFNNRIDHIPFNSDEGISRIARVYSDSPHHKEEREYWYIHLT